MKKRFVNLDIIRIFAFFCVVAVHFFLHTNFYATIMGGVIMNVAVLPLSFFKICVPLFIILTGYLMNKKELNRNYYYGIKHTLIVYVIVSIITIIFRSAF